MKKTIWVTAFLLLLQSVSVLAAEPTAGDMMTALEGMKKQMMELQQTIEKQNVRIQQLESRKVLEAPQPNADLQPTGAQPAATMSDADFQKGISDNIGKSVPWMKGLKLGGDFRLRAESFNFSDNNPDEN